MYCFEIYLLADEVTADDWQKLHLTVSGYLGFLKSYEFQMRVEKNVVRYFIVAEKDISAIANNLSNMILRPAEEEDVKLPHAQRKIRLLRFVTGGNLLDAREKYQVKTAAELNVAHFKVRQLNPNKASVKARFFLKGAGDIWSVNTKPMLSFPTHLLAVDFSENAAYLKKPTPKYLNIEKSLGLLSSSESNPLFRVDTFPYFSQDYFVNIGSYDFDRHSLIIGSSGSGKSKLIELLINRIYDAGLDSNYRVVVIDPHAALAPNLEHIPSRRIINFANEASDLFPTTSEATAATELSVTLIKSLLADQTNPKLERVLRFSLYVLYTAQIMDFMSLKRFINELEYRQHIISTTQGIPANIVQFFQTDFNELKTQHYTEAIVPIISLIDEMELLPSMSQQASDTMAQTIQNNFLSVFSLSKVSVGEKVVKTLAGLLIQNIFMLAQARTFQQKVILIIDEVSVIQNPTLASILSEARKFNLSLILTQQYLSQVDKELRDSIFSNNSNYYTFKVSEEDARLLEGNINMEIPGPLLEDAKSKGLDERAFRVKFMTELNSREVLLRLYSNGQFYPCVRATTVDVEERTTVPVDNPAAPAKPREEVVITETMNIPSTAPPPMPSPEMAPVEPVFEDVTPVQSHPPSPEFMVSESPLADEHMSALPQSDATDATSEYDRAPPPPGVSQILFEFSSNSKFKSDPEEKKEKKHG